MVSLLQRVTFSRRRKSNQKGLPRRTAFAALRFPRSGPAPWARRHGPSLAHRGSPGIHAGRPTPQNLLSASRRGGQIKSTAHRGGRPAGLFGSRVLRNLCRYSVAGQALMWERACSRTTFASRLAPTVAVFLGSGYRNYKLTFFRDFSHRFANCWGEGTTLIVGARR